MRIFNSLDHTIFVTRRSYILGQRKAALFDIRHLSWVLRRKRRTQRSGDHVLSEVEGIPSGRLEHRSYVLWIGLKKRFLHGFRLPENMLAAFLRYADDE